MDSLFIDYDDSLIGRKKKIGSYHFYGPDAGGANEKRALSLIQYAIESVLGWDADEAVKKFDRYMVESMKLQKIITYIQWPSEIQDGDTRYILSLLYPDKIHINSETLAQETYQRVLDGEASFPREYFAGAEGYNRYCMCLKYLAENYLSFSNILDLYDFFTSPAGRKYLDQKRIKTPGDILGIRIIDVLHELTRDEPEGEIVYCYYDFIQALKKSGINIPYGTNFRKKEKKAKNS